MPLTDLLEEKEHLEKEIHTKKLSKVDRAELARKKTTAEIKMNLVMHYENIMDSHNLVHTLRDQLMNIRPIGQDIILDRPLEQIDQKVICPYSLAEELIKDNVLIQAWEDKAKEQIKKGKFAEFYRAQETTSRVANYTRHLAQTFLMWAKEIPDKAASDHYDIIDFYTDPKSDINQNEFVSEVPNMETRVTDFEKAKKHLIKTHAHYYPLNRLDHVTKKEKHTYKFIQNVKNPTLSNTGGFIAIDQLAHHIYRDMEEIHKAAPKELYLQWMKQFSEKVARNPKRSFTMPWGSPELIKSMGENNSKLLKDKKFLEEAHKFDEKASSRIYLARALAPSIAKSKNIDELKKNIDDIELKSKAIDVLLYGRLGALPLELDETRYQGQKIKEDTEKAVTFYLLDLGKSFEDFMQDAKTMGTDTITMLENLPTRYERQLLKEGEGIKLVKHLQEQKDTAVMKHTELLEEILKPKIRIPEVINNTEMEVEVDVEPEEKDKMTAQELIKEIETLRPKIQKVENFTSTLPSYMTKDGVSYLDSTTLLYEKLGKDLSHLKKDLVVVGPSLGKLNAIYNNLKDTMKEDELISFVNYVRKQRSRDMLDVLRDSTVPKSILKKVFENKIGKKQKFKVLEQLQEAHEILGIDTSKNPKEVIEQIPFTDTEEYIGKIKEIKRDIYTGILGRLGAKPTDSLPDSIENLIFTYLKDSGKSSGVNSRPAIRILTNRIIKDKKSLDGLLTLSKNKKVEKKLKEAGIDTEAYRSGIEREYTLRTDPKTIETTKLKIAQELDHANYCLAQVFGDFQKKDSTIEEGVLNAEKFIKEYSPETKTEKNFIEEATNHLEVLKGIGYSTKESQKDVKFYVSQDIEETLQMGNIFGSCLKLSGRGGVNAWAAVGHAIDANKNVLYAKAGDEIIGRNRTTLTDKGILCTDFFSKGNLDLNPGWIEYLQEYSNSTGEDITIPKGFVSGNLEELLNTKTKKGEIEAKNQEMRIEPAYLKGFYGDRLETEKLDNGGTLVKTKGYVLTPQK